MPMRSELSVPAMRSDWGARETKLSWRQISENLRHPDAAVVLAFAAIGLLAAVSLMLLFPFLDYRHRPCAVLLTRVGTRLTTPSAVAGTSVKLPRRLTSSTMFGASAAHSPARTAVHSVLLSA